MYEIESCHLTWYCTFGSFVFLPQGPLEAQSTKLSRSGVSQIIMYTISMRLVHIPTADDLEDNNLPSQFRVG